MDGQPQQKQLISKLQYNTFEPGEFTDRQERTYDQTIAIIELFPWETQRDHLVVSLTNPSVTIEGPGGNFLKLALYYNGKYVLYYLDEKKHFFTKSVERCEDAYPLMLSFFEESIDFDPQGMKKELNALVSRLPHFADGNFYYRVNLLRALWFGFAFLFLFLFFLIMSLIELFGDKENKSLIILFLSPAIAVSGYYVLRLWNHYRYSRDLILHMTKGNDLFSFGLSTRPLTYHKKDILYLTTYGRRGRNGSFSGSLTREEIRFSDGRSIDISSLSIDHYLLLDKLPGIQLKEVKTYAFIPLSSSSPS